MLLRLSITAKSVACPLPVSDSDPYKSTRMDRVTLSLFSFLSSDKKRSAALHGPKVCELDGPTPIFNMSKTEIHSSIESSFRNRITDYCLF